MFNKQNNYVSPEDATFPFDKLDKSSAKLRSSATKLAELLSSDKSQSTELKSLITSLNNIASSNIRKIDEAFINFKNAFATLTVRNKENNIFGSGFSDEHLPPIMEEYTVLIEEMVALSDQANKLSS